MDEKALLVKHWLVKASHDLAAARRLRRAMFFESKSVAAAGCPFVVI